MSATLAMPPLTYGMPPHRHTFPPTRKRAAEAVEEVGEDATDTMSSFINTMSVYTSSPPPQPYTPPPKPLPALHTNVLAESESTIHKVPPAGLLEAYKSPLQRRLHSVVAEASTTYSGSNIPVPVRIENQTHDIQRGATRGLGGAMGWMGQHVAKQADILTYSNNNARTRGTAFQPQKRAKGTSSWQLKQFAEATLGSGSLRKVVQLPEGEDRDEWLAVNVVDFYNQINLLYGAITEFCSPTTCPEMKATDEFEYLWHDPPTYPKPTRLPAPTYISHLLTWTSQHLSNPSVFPTEPGVPFPADFEKTVKVLFKRLYRIYAHIYCHHYGVVRGLGLEAHLNTGFKHYVLFVEEFDLANGRGKGRGEWFGPLGELVESMLRSD